MSYVRILVITLAIVEAGWMTFDGTRAFVIGDYVTPRAGVHAGQLGPWHHVMSAIGIPPRSNLMKAIFVSYGALWLIVIVAFIRGYHWAWAAMLIAAAGSLWYLPIGTVFGLAQILGLVWLRRTT